MRLVNQLTTKILILPLTVPVINYCRGQGRLHRFSSTPLIENSHSPLLWPSPTPHLSSPLSLSLSLFTSCIGLSLHSCCDANMHHPCGHVSRCSSALLYVFRCLTKCLLFLFILKIGTGLWKCYDWLVYCAFFYGGRTWGKDWCHKQVS